jgi:hypothetical protein
MNATTVLITAVLVAGTGATWFGADSREPQHPDPRNGIFVKRGCTDCHAITALRLRSSADVGPDLTFAYADVVTRYGVNLESFLVRPTGVMQLVLASQPRLSAMDRDSVTRILKRLYLERRAHLDRTAPLFPPATGPVRAHVIHAVP